MIRGWVRKCDTPFHKWQLLKWKWWLVITFLMKMIIDCRLLGVPHFQTHPYVLARSQQGTWLNLFLKCQIQHTAGLVASINGVTSIISCKPPFFDVEVAIPTLGACPWSEKPEKKTRIGKGLREGQRPCWRLALTPQSQKRYPIDPRMNHLGVNTMPNKKGVQVRIRHEQNESCVPLIFHE